MTDFQRVSSRAADRVPLNNSAGSSGFSCIAGSSVFYSSGSSRRKTGFTGGRTITTAVLAIQAVQMVAAPFANAYVPSFTDPLQSQTVTGETITAGTQHVLDGGSAVNTSIEDNGEQYISRGGTTISTAISSYATQVIFDGGTAIDTTVARTSSYQIVSEGGIASGTIVNMQGSQVVSSGGSAVNTTINYAGTQVVDGGIASGTTINSSGTQIISNGTAIGTDIVYREGLQIIETGGIASGASIDSGGAQHISNGGTAYDTTLTNNGEQNISDGGIAYRTVVSDEGTLYLSNGGKAYDTTLNADGYMDLERGGIAQGITLNSGGDLTVLNGGSALDVTQKEGSVLSTDIVGGDTTVITGSNASGQFSLSGGVANNFILYSNAGQWLKNGGIANNTIISSGGRQGISNGGIANNTLISSGGQQIIYNGGTANDTTISTGGRQDISTGGIASGTIISSGGSQFISNGGSAVGTTINEFGFQYVSEGGTASGTVLNAHAHQEISKGGIVFDNIVNIDGYQDVFSSGVASRTTIVGSDGYQRVNEYGTAFDTTVSNGGKQIVSGTSAVANGTLVSSGGSQSVSNGGIASSTTIHFGGSQLVRNGGIASDTTVSSGGSQFISSGGIVSNTTLDAGAIQQIFNGGQIHGNATYNRGATLYAAGGSLSGGNLVFNGGTFQPALNVNNTNANAFTVSGNVTGMAGATIAPVWTAGTPLSAGTSASFLVLKADGGTLDSTSGFGTTTKLVKAVYTQRVENNNELYIDAIGKKAGLQENYGDWLSPNAYRVAGSLDKADDLGVLPGVMTAIGNLTDDGAVVNHAVDQLSPDVLPTSLLTGVASIRSFQQNLPTAFSQNGVQSNNFMLNDGDQPSLKNGTTVFVNPYGSFTDQGSRHGYHGYDFNAGGISFGAVRSLDNAWVGVAAGYNHQKLDMKGQRSDLEADQAVLSLFGGKSFGSFVLEGGLGYAHSWNDTTRHVGFSGYNAKNEGSFGQDFIFANANLSYVHKLASDWRVIPSVGVDYVYAHSDSFTESGSDSALKVDSASYHSVEIPIAVRFDKTFRLKSGAAFTPKFSLAWIPQVGDTYGETTASFVDASSAGTFGTRSVSPGRNRGRASVGFDAGLADKWTFRLDYAIDVAGSYSGHNVFAHFRKAF